MFRFKKVFKFPWLRVCHCSPKNKIKKVFKISHQSSNSMLQKETNQVTSYKEKIVTLTYLSETFSLVKTKCPNKKVTSKNFDPLGTPVVQKTYPLGTPAVWEKRLFDPLGTPAVLTCFWAKTFSNCHPPRSLWVTQEFKWIHSFNFVKIPREDATISSYCI